MSAELSRDKGQFHAIRMTIVTAAIDASLRGNRTQYLQAQALASGAKGNLAKAYRAGFAAVPAPEKFAYSGKLTAAVAEQIATKATELAQAFSDAFVKVAPLTKAEQTEDEKAKAEAAKKAKADKAAIARAEELGYVKPREVGVSELTEQVVALIAAGQIEGENLALIATACKQVARKAKQTANV
jgi:hypothetical protein